PAVLLGPLNPGASLLAFSHEGVYFIAYVKPLTTDAVTIKPFMELRLVILIALDHSNKDKRPMVGALKGRQSSPDVPRPPDLDGFPVTDEIDMARPAHDATFFALRATRSRITSEVFSSAPRA